ncbi:tail fiber domain-containing protein [Fluviicola sp.]|jgi:hypothetical protein|uniref:tail fiber domain-containing protein n=1 Tax=Fluviicola sp. TaxID=1917219 RepID=UPI00281703DB|nr:tail fiber domain-containing protein [Fluviicola sp.]MDR0802875.1 tail fiber domain-containing protein [Fluviicola sp.]
MKNIVAFLFLIISGQSIYSQVGRVGINTSDPKATLEVKAVSTVPGYAEGIIPPRLTGDQLTGKNNDYGTLQNGVLVYITEAVTGTATGKTANVTTSGYYYYNADAGLWMAMTGNDWHLTGNSDVTGNSYLGTSTDVDLVFKRDNVNAGLLNASDTNTVFGVGAFLTGNGQNNTAVGNGALASTTVLVTNNGSNNTAIGAKALAANTTGYVNTAVGVKALAANTTGYANVAVGRLTLADNTEGYMNVAVGASALRKNVNGTTTVAVGYGALASSTGTQSSVAIGTNAFMTLSDNGGANTGIGNVVGQYQASGTDNTYIGNSTGGQKGSGNGNTFIGANAGKAAPSGISSGATPNSTGNNNTFVGVNAGMHVTSGSSNVIIGGDDQNNYLITGSNNILIGYGAIPSSSSATGEVTIGKLGTSGYARLTQGATGWTFTSDRQLKHDIKPIEQGLNFVKKLKPVEYAYNSSTDGKKALGFVAQDVQEVMQQENMGNDYGLVPVIDEKGGTLGLNYIEFIPILTKAIQEQQAVIEKQQQTIDALQKRIERLELNQN